MVAWVLIAVVSLGLFGPALDVGFLADDLFQISMLEGGFGSHSPLDLYAYARPESDMIAARIRSGSLPWWTVESFRFAMFRPLSSALVAIDHTVFEDNAWAHHVHSLGWFFAALFAAYRLLSRVLDPWWATLAVGLWAVDETMVWMIGWLANRCALVCAVFGLMALTIHHRARTRRSRLSLWELGAWVLAFAGGEYALGAVAYLVAYELVVPTDGWKRRMWASSPAALVVALYSVGYVLGDYGVYGANTYIDPIRDPGPFLEALPHRLPRMLGEVWLNFAGEGERFWYRYQDLAAWVMPKDGSDLSVQAWRHARFSLVVAVASVGLVGWSCWPSFQEHERRFVRWAALGSLLSMVPLAAVTPATRSLLFPNLGAAVVVAGFSLATLRAWRSGGGSGLRKGVLTLGTLGFLWLHAAREARYCVEQVDALLEVRVRYRSLYQNPSFVALDLTGKHVVVIATPGLVTGIHGRSMLELFGRGQPETWHVLAMSQRPYLVRRSSPHAIELSSVGGPMHRSPQASLFRAKEDALRPGDTVDAGIFRATVLHERPGVGPDAVRFDFDLPLNDPRLLFLEVGPEGLRPFEIPGGRPVAIRPPQLPSVVPRG